MGGNGNGPVGAESNTSLQLSELSGGGKKKNKTKRKLSSWNLFVMDLKKKNRAKSFKEVLKLASKLKKKGLNTVKFASKVGKNTLTKLGKAVTGKKKKSKRKTKKGKKGKK